MKTLCPGGGVYQPHPNYNKGGLCLTGAGLSSGADVQCHCFIVKPPGTCNFNFWAYAFNSTMSYQEEVMWPGMLCTRHSD